LVSLDTLIQHINDHDETVSIAVELEPKTYGEWALDVATGGELVEWLTAGKYGYSDFAENEEAEQLVDEALAMYKRLYTDLYAEHLQHQADPEILSADMWIEEIWQRKFGHVVNLEADELLNKAISMIEENDDYWRVFCG